jgi:hypothetical protein
MAPLTFITSQPHGVDARDKRGHDVRKIAAPRNIEAGK